MTRSFLFLVFAIIGLFGTYAKAQYQYAPQAQFAQTAPQPGSVDNRFGFLGPLGPPRFPPPGALRPQVGPFAPQPNQGFVSNQPGPSISGANSESYTKEIDNGKFGVTKSLSQTQSFTENNQGLNGERTQSISKGFNVGNFDVAGTLTKGQEYNNGRVTQELKHELDIGKVGLDTTISRDNLQKGFGIVKNSDGSQSLNLGLINFDLNRNTQTPGAAGTSAGVNAVGEGAQTQSNSDTSVDKQKYGNIEVTQTHSKSDALGIVENGYTDGTASAQGGGSNTVSNSGPFRNPNIIPGPFGRTPFGLFRQKRTPQFSFPGSFGRPQNVGFQQQNAANAGSNNVQNQFGQFQNNMGSAISSNLANDGKSGQLSSSNANQESFKTAQGVGNKNTAQGQSANFGDGFMQLSGANSDTIYTKGPNGERQETNAGANGVVMDKFGTSSNIANAGTVQFNENGIRGEQSQASSQSINQNQFGGMTGSFANSNTETKQGPNGQTISSSSASSSSSSVSGKGGNTGSSANASASSGNVNGQSFNNAAASGNTFANPGFGSFQQQRFPQPSFPQPAFRQPAFGIRG